MMKDRYFFWLFIASFAGGIFLRFYNLGEQSYWMDEGFTINAVLSILERGKPVLYFGQAYHCELYCYPTASFTKLFGQTAFAYRFLAAIAGTVLIIAVYLTLKQLYNNKIASLASFFTAFSYWQIAWSRQARWYSLLALTTWLSLYFFYRIYQGERKWSLVPWCIFFSALSVALQPIALIPIGLMIVVLMLKGVTNKKGDLIYLSIIFLLLFFVPPLIWKLITNDVWYSAIAWLQNLRPSYSLPYYLGFYVKNYWPMIMLSLIAIQRHKYKFITLGTTIFFLTLLVFSLSTDLVSYRYLYYLTPFLLAGTAAGLYEIVTQVNKPILKLATVIAIIAFLITANQLVFWPKQFYLLESDKFGQANPRPHVAYTPQPDFNSAYNFIQNNLTDEDLIISSHPVFTKIFLDQSGYWLAHDLIDTKIKVGQSRDIYVGAIPIRSVEELEKLIREKHGFLVFDYASGQKIDRSIINFISGQLNLVYTKTINESSKISVYKF